MHIWSLAMIIQPACIMLAVRLQKLIPFWSVWNSEKPISGKRRQRYRDSQHQMGCVRTNDEVDILTCLLPPPPPPALFWSVCLVCIYSQMFMVRAYLCAGSSIRGPLRWLWRLLRTSSEPPTSISWRASSASASIQSRRWAIWPLPGSFQYHSYAYIYI